MFLDGHGDRLRHGYGHFLCQDGGDAVVDAERKRRVGAETQSAEAVGSETAVAAITQGAVEASLLLLCVHLSVALLRIFREGNRHQGEQEDQL